MPVDSEMQLRRNHGRGNRELLPPGERRYFVHKRLFGAAKAFIGSGFSPTAAGVGFLTAGRPRAVSRRTPEPAPRRRRAALSARTRTPTTAPRPVTRLRRAAVTREPTAAPRPVTRLAGVERFRGPLVRTIAACGVGFEMRGGRCVRTRPEGFIPKIRQALVGPPSERLVRPARREVAMEAVVGAFGMPAMVPDEEMVPRFRCPRGMVLGTDNLCYPRGVLNSRNLNRKWRRPPKPTVSAADAKAIRRAAATKERVLQLAKDVGLHASKSRPSSRGKKQHQHLIAAPARELRVVHGETN